MVGRPGRLPPLAKVPPKPVLAPLVPQISAGAVLSSHRGLAVSPGIVIGRILLLEDDIHRITKRQVSSAAVPGEIARFDRAVKDSTAELQTVFESARKEMGEEAAKIFLVHIAMMSDRRTFTSPVKAMIESEEVTAEYAVSQVLCHLPVGPRIGMQIQRMDAVGHGVLGVAGHY